MEDGTRIIRIDANDGSANVSTFEEAFGEHSEFKGRGRARRQARKLDRIAKKSERKSAKQEARAVKQENRSAIRSGRKTRRQDSKAQRQEAIQSRRDVRKTRKVARRSMGDEPQTSQSETPYDETSVPQEEPQNYAPQEVPQEDSREDSQGDSQGYDDSQEEWGGGVPQSGYDEEEEQDDEDAEDSYDDSSFDGQSEFDYAEGESSVKVDPKVADISKRVEWNKELISRLKSKLSTVKSQQVSNDIQKQIAERQERLSQLRAVLKSYSKCEGDFSGADGEFVECTGCSSNADGEFSEARGGKKREQLKRRRELKKSHRMAKRERLRARKAASRETPVEEDLSPEFSDQRIEVPAENNSNFIGDGNYTKADDFDAPKSRVIELHSNASGIANIDWKAIAIGVGVAAVAIWAIKKYKVLGK